MVNSGASGWTEERIERLKALVAEGKTGAEIAADLGGVTRNGVIGKAHRLGLSFGFGGPPRPRAPRPKRSPVPRDMVIKARSEEPLPPEPEAPGARNIPLDSLRGFHCRTVTGSAGFGLPLYCGRRVAPPRGKEAQGTLCDECRGRFRILPAKKSA